MYLNFNTSIFVQNVHFSVHCPVFSLPYPPTLAVSHQLPFSPSLASTHTRIPTLNVTEIFHIPSMLNQQFCIFQHTRALPNIMAQQWCNLSKDDPFGAVRHNKFQLAQIGTTGTAFPTVNWLYCKSKYHEVGNEEDDFLMTTDAELVLMNQCAGILSKDRPDSKQQ